MPLPPARKLEDLKAAGLAETATRYLARSADAGTRHEFLAHTPVWAYCDPAGSEAVTLKGGGRLYEILPADSPPEFVSGRTRMAVLIGARLTPELLHFMREPGVVLLFEPERERLLRFLELLEPQVLEACNVFIFAGDPARMRLPLSRLLPPDLFKIGYPVFYVLEGLKHPDYVGQVVEQIEFFFYRNSLYQLFGQEYSRSLPLRPIRMGLNFDQYLHLYQNIRIYASNPDIGVLAGACAGLDAVVALSGPGLAEQLDLLAEVRDRAVLICAVTSLRPLLATGIEPDFVLMSDTSRDMAHCLRELAIPERTALIGHCLSFLAAPGFPRRFVYGNWMPELFGTRPDLHTHGSVVTTAYALARHLGCSGCVLVGANLAGTDPWRLSYAKGTEHHLDQPRARPLTNRWPQLYPCLGADGSRLYTTLNFYDTARWLLDEISLHPDIRVINTNADSILHGPGIRLDRDYRPDQQAADRAAGVLAGLRSLARTSAITPEVRAFAAAELDFWTGVSERSRICLENIQEGGTGPDGLLTGLAASLDALDRSGATYALHRFRAFDNRGFCAKVFESGAVEQKLSGYVYYFQWMREMAEVLRRPLLGVTSAG